MKSFISKFLIIFMIVAVCGTGIFFVVSYKQKNNDNIATIQDVEGDYYIKENGLNIIVFNLDDKNYINYIGGNKNADIFQLFYENEQNKVNLYKIGVQESIASYVFDNNQKTLKSGDDCFYKMTDEFNKIEVSDLTNGKSLTIATGNNLSNSEKNYLVLSSNVYTDSECKNVFNLNDDVSGISKLYLKARSVEGDYYIIKNGLKYLCYSFDKNLGVSVYENGEVSKKYYTIVKNEDKMFVCFDELQMELDTQNQTIKNEDATYKLATSDMVVLTIENQDKTANYFVSNKVIENAILDFFDSFGNLYKDSNFSTPLINNESFDADTKLYVKNYSLLGDFYATDSVSGLKTLFASFDETKKVVFKKNGIEITKDYTISKTNAITYIDIDGESYVYNKTNGTIIFGDKTLKLVTQDMIKVSIILKNGDMETYYSNQIIDSEIEKYAQSFGYVYKDSEFSADFDFSKTYTQDVTLYINDYYLTGVYYQNENLVAHIMYEFLDNNICDDMSGSVVDYTMSYKNSSIIVAVGGKKYAYDLENKSLTDISDNSIVLYLKADYQNIISVVNVDKNDKEFVLVSDTINDVTTEFIKKCGYPYADKNCTTDFDFLSTISGDTVVYVKSYNLNQVFYSVFNEMKYAEFDFNDKGSVNVFGETSTKYKMSYNGELVVEFWNNTLYYNSANKTLSNKQGTQIYYTKTETEFVLTINRLDMKNTEYLVSTGNLSQKTKDYIGLNRYVYIDEKCTLDCDLSKEFVQDCSFYTINYITGVYYENDEVKVVKVKFIDENQMFVNLNNIVCTTNYKVISNGKNIFVCFEDGKNIVEIAYNVENYQLCYMISSSVEKIYDRASESEKVLTIKNTKDKYKLVVLSSSNMTMVEDVCEAQGEVFNEIECLTPFIFHLNIDQDKTIYIKEYTVSKVFYEQQSGVYFVRFMFSNDQTVKVYDSENGNNIYDYNITKISVDNFVVTFNDKEYAYQHQTLKQKNNEGAKEYKETVHICPIITFVKDDNSPDVLALVVSTIENPLKNYVKNYGFAYSDSECTNEYIITDSIVEDVIIYLKKDIVGVFYENINGVHKVAFDIVSPNEVVVFVNNQIVVANYTKVADGNNLLYILATHGSEICTINYDTKLGCFVGNFGSGDVEFKKANTYDSILTIQSQDKSYVAQYIETSNMEILKQEYAKIGYVFNEISLATRYDFGKIAISKTVFVVLFKEYIPQGAFYGESGGLKLVSFNFINLTQVKMYINSVEEILDFTATKQGNNSIITFDGLTYIDVVYNIISKEIALTMVGESGEIILQQADYGDYVIKIDRAESQLAVLASSSRAEIEAEIEMFGIGYLDSEYTQIFDECTQFTEDSTVFVKNYSLNGSFYEDGEMIKYVSFEFYDHYTVIVDIDEEQGVCLYNYSITKDDDNFTILFYAGSVKVYASYDDNLKKITMSGMPSGKSYCMATENECVITSHFNETTEKIVTSKKMNVNLIGYYEEFGYSYTDSEYTNPFDYNQILTGNVEIYIACGVVGAYCVEENDINSVAMNFINENQAYIYLTGKEVLTNYTLVFLNGGWTISFEEYPDVTYKYNSAMWKITNSENYLNSYNRKSRIEYLVKVYNSCDDGVEVFATSILNAQFEQIFNQENVRVYANSSYTTLFDFGGELTSDIDLYVFNAEVAISGDYYTFYQGGNKLINYTINGANKKILINQSSGYVQKSFVFESISYNQTTISVDMGNGVTESMVFNGSTKTLIAGGEIHKQQTGSYYIISVVLQQARQMYKFVLCGSVIGSELAHCIQGFGELYEDNMYYESFDINSTITKDTTIYVKAN